MDETPADNARPLARAASGRLDSWKKIAAHFNRDVTTVQRWERREGMPVHRHLHDKQGSVYAFRSELDVWWENRCSKVADPDGRVTEVPAPSGESPTPDPAPNPTLSTIDEEVVSQPARRVVRPAAWLAAVVAGLLVTYGLARFEHANGERWKNPFARATFTRLTDWPGMEQAAVISRDGRSAFFLADHAARIDAWLTQIGSGSYRAVTQGDRIELVNPSIRPLGFSADGSFVTVWTRSADGSHSEDIKLMAAPTAGGEMHDFLPGVAEASWSSDGRQLAYHTTAPGDPLFVRDARSVVRQIYAAPPGIHCHFPVWSKDDAYLYFTRGIPPEHWDVWRIRPSGAGLERITFHDSRVSHPVLLDDRTLAYLASDTQGAGPWVYALDVDQREPHRISFGLERYTSLAASADGNRLLATLAESTSSIWSVPLAGEAGDSHDQRASLVSALGLSPRRGPNYLLFVSSRAGRQSIWKRTADGEDHELWSDSHLVIPGAPTVARDGRHIAFTATDAEKTVLYTMDSDGKDVRPLTRDLALRGNPAWAPDGRSVFSGVLRDGEPRLMRIYLDGKEPTPLVSEYSIDPIWSPDGRFVIYSGADVGTTFPLRAVAEDGRPYPMSPLILTRGARHVAFLSDAESIVVLKGDVGHKNFWRVNLRTGVERQLTELPPDVSISDFDLSPRSDAILFDNVKESSRIALIERGG